MGSMNKPLEFAGKPVILSTKMLEGGVVLLMTETHGVVGTTTIPNAASFKKAYWAVENELQRQFGDPGAWRSRKSAMPAVREAAQKLVEAAFGAKP